MRFYYLRGIYCPLIVSLCCQYVRKLSLLCTLNCVEIISESGKFLFCHFFSKKNVNISACIANIYITCFTYAFFLFISFMFVIYSLPKKYLNKLTKIIYPSWVREHTVY